MKDKGHTVADNFAVNACHIAKLGPGKRMVEIIFDLVVFRQVVQVLVLDVQKVGNLRLFDAHHGFFQNANQNANIYTLSE